MSSTPSATIQFGAAAFAGGRAFFGGLEDKDYRAAQLLAHLRQHFGHAHEDRYVAIVAAGVHHAYFVAVVFGFSFGSKGKVCLFGDGQAVHIGSQGHYGAGQAAFEHAYYAGFAYAFAHLVEFQAFEVFGDDFSGAELPVGQLGKLVQIAAPGNDLGFYRSSQLVELGFELGIVEWLCALFTLGKAVYGAYKKEGDNGEK